jgi:release factor glutamine methyltransferase
MNDLELIKEYVPIEKQSEALNKLKEGYPVQYIIGNVDFYGNIIEVNESVLIPRFETEYLVYKTIKYLEKLNIINPNIFEIGSGSGCISIALKKEVDCNITSIDISSKAIDVAKLNAQNNNVEINFQVCDIHNYKSDEKFDLIISNPPYVDYDEDVDIETKYEPQNAIFADNHGLVFYEYIIKESTKWVKDKSIIAFEIGYNQGEYLLDYAKKYYPNAIISINKDLSERDRYLLIINK